MKLLEALKSVQMMLSMSTSVACTPLDVDSNSNDSEHWLDAGLKSIFLGFSPTRSVNTDALMSLDWDTSLSSGE